ncbi:hypothetical protein JCM14244_05920 [Venenivibrio stagnispumantis]|uniref:Uncharacterized protein n=2 Tax=Venenivibrio stagnispumantis TaxID=407998 RepID=A0AA45WIA8_9AQUI|nr:hypothetical protein [Venenivibrio stagnispumantis]SMP00308.1 hypothetical protein SAMN06264868_10151 [Venenivibrio stagnispumantis]
MNYKKLSISLLLEMSAIAFLLMNNLYGIIVFYTFHSLASFILSLVLYPLIPIKFKIRNNKIFFIFFVTLIQIATLLVGYIFFIFIVLWLLRHQEKPEEKFLDKFSYSEIFEFPSVKRQFGESAIIEVLTGKTQKATKLKLVSLLSEFKSKEAIQVIKTLLSEKDDEIRLMSFGIINKIETKINREIKEKLDILEKKLDNLEKAYIYKDLAKLYWELVYLEIADKEIEKFLLEKVKYYIEESKKFGLEDAEIFFLEGRVLLEIYKEKEFLKKIILEQALNKFLEAIKYKYPKEKVYPYIAEIYFYKKEYKRLKEILQEIKDIAKYDFKLYPILEVWE